MCNWDPKQPASKDTPEQAEARRLWKIADRLAVRADKAENQYTVDLLIGYIGLVLRVWAVYEDRALFEQYVQVEED